MHADVFDRLTTSDRRIVHNIADGPLRRSQSYTTHRLEMHAAGGFHPPSPDTVNTRTQSGTDLALSFHTHQKNVACSKPCINKIRRRQHHSNVRVVIEGV